MFAYKKMSWRLHITTDRREKETFKTPKRKYQSESYRKVGNLMSSGEATSAFYYRWRHRPQLNLHRLESKTRYREAIYTRHLMPCTRHHRWFRYEEFRNINRHGHVRYKRWRHYWRVYTSQVEDCGRTRFYTGWRHNMQLCSSTACLFVCTVFNGTSAQ